MHLFPIKIHHKIYLAGIFLLVVGLPLSKVLMSLGGLILSANWLLEGNFRHKAKSFFSNKAALVLVSIWLLHIIGLVWTADFQYAIKDIKIKLPLLYLPIIFSTSEILTKKKFYFFLWMFILSVFLGTLYSVFLMKTTIITNTRDLSVLISHIRFSLLIAMAFFITAYFFTSKSQKLNIKVFSGILAIWFIVFLFIVEFLTGLAILFITSFLLIIIISFKIKPRKKRLVIISLLVMIPLGLSVFIYTLAKNYFTVEDFRFEKLDSHTINGNSYIHDTINYPIENGKYIGVYLCMDELREAWHIRSEIDFEGEDASRQSLKYTLIRFLNSKSLRKDSVGVMSLTDKEITSIENGTANVKYLKKYNFSRRIYEIFWEISNYQNTKDPSGHSIMQRIEYWKAAIGIIKSKPLLGVGTGDLNRAYEQQYELMESKLKSEFRLRAHNQYLTMGVAFGLTGGVLFLFFLIYPAINKRGFFNYFYLIFFLIASISMIYEDTLETQAGVTFFAFFNTFLLFAIPLKKHDKFFNG